MTRTLGHSVSLLLVLVAGACFANGDGTTEIRYDWNNNSGLHYTMPGYRVLFDSARAMTITREKGSTRAKAVRVYRTDKAFRHPVLYPDAFVEHDSDGLLLLKPDVLTQTFKVNWNGNGLVPVILQFVDGEGRDIEGSWNWDIHGPKPSGAMQRASPKTPWMLFAGPQVFVDGGSGADGRP